MRTLLFLLLPFLGAAQQARHIACTSSGAHVSGDFSADDTGAYLYAIQTETPYIPSYTVQTVAERDAISAANGTICKVLQTADPRYPGFSGTQYFRKHGSAWQLLPTRTNALRRIISACDTSATLDYPINTAGMFTALVGPDYYAELQEQAQVGGDVTVPKGKYLVILDTITQTGVAPGPDCRIRGDATLYIVAAKEYTTSPTISVFRVNGSYNTDSPKRLLLSGVEIKGFAFDSPLRETQARTYGINWVDGSGQIVVENCRFTGLFGAIQSTGDCLPPCTGDRTLNVGNTKIDSIYGVAIGCFGKRNFLNMWRVDLWRVGVVSKWTWYNAEYGQGVYLHKKNSFHISSCNFKEIRTHAITPFSSGGAGAAIQYIGNCTFKNIGGGVLTDADGKTTITACTFDAAQIGIQGPCLISDCTFLDSSWACIYASCCASQPAPFTYRVQNCHFANVRSYALDHRNSANQAVTGVFSNCTVVNSAGAGINAHSGELRVENVTFTGPAARSIYADGGAVFVSNCDFRQTNQTQTIFATGCTSLRGMCNWFYSPTIRVDGTCAGFLKYNNIDGAANWVVSNPNFWHD